MSNIELNLVDNLIKKNTIEELELKKENKKLLNKLWRKKNKEILIIKNKEYYEKTKDKAKEYYLNIKEKIYEKKLCDCGKLYNHNRKVGRVIHENSNHHKEYINSLN